MMNILFFYSLPFLCRIYGRYEKFVESESFSSVTLNDDVHCKMIELSAIVWFYLAAIHSTAKSIFQTVTTVFSNNLSRIRHC